MEHDKKAMAAAIQQIASEKGIPVELIVEKLQLALAAAYRKDFGEKNQNVQCLFDLDNGSWRLFDVKTVSDKPVRPEMTEEEAAAAEAEKAAILERGEDLPEEIDYLDEKEEVTVAEAQKLKKGAVVGDVIKTELMPPAEYGRMAAQTAKQVVIQGIREAERDRVFEQFQDRVGEIISVFVQRVEGRVVFCDLGNALGILPPAEQAQGERYRPGDRIKVYVISVTKGTKGAEILLSRAHVEMVRKLFMIEVPEIEAGTVEIKGIAREAGSRTKIAVVAHQANVDPVGSCVGQRGSRVQTIISELGGEKIDIIEWSDDVVQYITNALSPAKIMSVQLDDDKKTARIEVHTEQLSLAIGRSGQNVRLASQLVNWRIELIEVDDQGNIVSRDDREQRVSVDTAPAVEAVEPVAEAPTTEVAA